MKSLIPTLVLLALLAACVPSGSTRPAPTQAAETLTPAPRTGASSTAAPSATWTPTPATLTDLPLPTKSPTPLCACMPQPTAETVCANPSPQGDDPTYIATLGDCGAGPWSGGELLFSPDGKLIVMINYQIWIWDVNTHALVREIQNPYAEACSVQNAAFSPDGKFVAVSVTYCRGNELTGHILIWDIDSGKLLQDWKQADAKMPPTKSAEAEYSIETTALAFSPDSSMLVFANGNTIESRDILEKDRGDVIKLGPEMFASQLSLSSDGRFVYIQMDWLKSQSTWANKFNVQIWNLKNHTMVREIKYPESFDSTSLVLQGKFLYYTDREKWTSQVTDLETGKIRNIPLRKDGRYNNADGSLVIFQRYDEDAFELWTTDNWRNVYTFKPVLDNEFNGIAFSPDNTLLAFARARQVILYNIAPLVNPK